MRPYKVERNIPIPQKTGAGRKSKYPIALLKPGESFKVPTDKRQSVRAGISAHKKRHGGKFVTRTVNGGFRIWRVK